MISQQKILILGSNGFIGRRLHSILLEKKLQVITADIIGKVNISIDALDKVQMFETINRFKPDCIVNLLGYTDNEQPDRIYETNILPFIYIATALTKLKLNTRVVIISSAAEYGDSDSINGYLKENDPKKPVSHYGAAKYVQTMIGQLYHVQQKMDVVVARPFNIIGNGMSAKLVPACFIEKFLKHPGTQKIAIIKTKNLDTIRDFLSLDDVVKGLYKVITVGRSGEVYNICSGEGISIRTMFAMVAKEFSGINYEISEDISDREKNIIINSVGNNSKLKELGWKQEDSIETVIRDLISEKKKNPYFGNVYL